MGRLFAGHPASSRATAPEGASDNTYLSESEARLRFPQELFRLNELDVLYEQDARTLWTFMNPAERPSFTPSMLVEFERWQSLIDAGFADGADLDFLVLGSRTPNVFCFGGDLELFQRLIRQQDRASLVSYGFRCVAILHRNIHALNLPIVTIGLVQGAALGGGFEALLSFDHLIAETTATFGLPEILFGLFPGMGAHALLSRKLGSGMADRLILSNRTYTAQEMYDLGVVHQLAEPGEGLAATRAFIKNNAHRKGGICGAKRAMRESCSVSLAELQRIVEHWADSALQLREQDLKLMERLAAAQLRKVMRAPKAGPSETGTAPSVAWPLHFPTH